MSEEEVSMVTISLDKMDMYQFAVCRLYHSFGLEERR